MPTPQITALPTAPSRGQTPASFTADADAFVAALPTFGTEANTVATFCNTSATNAALSETNAASSETVALAASNFKGTWASLVGALNKPASVLHNSQYWILLNNLADVTTSQPGVSADWSRLDLGDAYSRVLSAVNFR